MAKLPKGSEVPTIVEGAEDGATFQVEVSAHLMALLAGLYSNREDSIVREVLCNAYDAQISIGVDAPVVIEPPSVASPTLKIRDQGPGMSRATVFKVYASYGTSTKGDSDEQTGGMGVGAKSVFCYTDTFTVISWHNGVEATYVAYLNGETGIPRIDLMVEVPCPQERTGIEVQIPVQIADIDTFNNAIRWNSQFHPTPPLVIGGAAVQCAYDVAPVELDLSAYGAKGWFAYPDWTSTAATAAGRPTNGVSMGSVLYPLTPPSMSLVSGLSVMFKCPMGAVRFAPSREVLKYDEVTVANLKKAGKAYVAAYDAWVNGLIANAEARDPGLLGEQVKQLHRLTQRKLATLLSKAVLTDALGAGIAKRFYPTETTLGDFAYRARGVDLLYFDDQGVRRTAATSPTTGKGVIMLQPLTTACWVARGAAAETRVRYANKCCVFFVRTEADGLALAAHLGLRVEGFLFYTDDLEAPPAREKIPKGRVSGNLPMYRSMDGSASLYTADDALEASGGVYVESMAGGHGWTSVSKKHGRQVTKQRYGSAVNLDHFKSANSWITGDVQLKNVLRLNQGDREKLVKKDIPLIPWIEQAMDCVDIDEVRRLHHVWTKLGLRHAGTATSYGSNQVYFIHTLFADIGEKLRPLLVNALNARHNGMGDLVEESIAARADIARNPAAKAGLLDEIERLLPEGDPVKAEPDLLALLQTHLGRLELFRAGITTPEQRKGVVLAMLSMLGVPDAVISRALGGELAVVPKRKAKAPSVHEGQLALFDEEVLAEAGALRAA